MPPTSCTAYSTGREPTRSRNPARWASHSAMAVPGTMTARYPTGAPPCWATHPAISGIATIAAAQAPLSMPKIVPSATDSRESAPSPLPSVASANEIVDTAARGPAVSTSARMSAGALDPDSAGSRPAASAAVARALNRRVRTRPPRRTTAVETRM